MFNTCEFTTKKRLFFELFLQIVRYLAWPDPKCGEFCGLFYKNIQGWVQTLQFGGTFPAGPDPDVQVWDCPNPMNRVQVELRRVKE